MAYVVLKGEKKIADVVGRAYGDLKVADAKRAEAVLLRANPQLARLRDLKAGDMIVVPPVPGVSGPPAERAELPAPAAVGDLRDALEAYRKQLGAAADAERTATTTLVDLLKSKELKALVRDVPDAGKYAERVSGATKDRREEHDRRDGFLKLLTKAGTDLDELAKKLG